MLRCEFLLAEVERLQAIVDSVPKDADGCNVPFGKPMYRVGDNGEIIEMMPETYIGRVDQYHRTREAAEKARNV